MEYGPEMGADGQPMYGDEMEMYEGDGMEQMVDEDGNPVGGPPQQYGQEENYGAEDVSDTELIQI